MKQIKNIVIILAIPYLFWCIYDNFLARQYKPTLRGELKKLQEFGGLYKRKVGKYAFRMCLDYQTYTLDNKMEDAGCIQNMKINSITYDTPTSYPGIIYRGKSTNEKYMCELDLGIVSEGKDAGDIECAITWFKASEIDEFKLGMADVYARKLKEKSTKK